MNIATIIAFVKEHKGAILSLGAVPAAFYAIKKLSGSKKHVTGPAKVIVKEDMPVESTPIRRRMTPARKNRIIGDVRQELITLIPEDYTITFGQSEKQGYRGYYVRKNDKVWLFLCWSNILEDSYGSSTFWIELSEAATVIFKDRNLKLNFDIYTHPLHTGRIVISVSDEDMRNSRGVADEVYSLVKEVF